MLAILSVPLELFGASARAAQRYPYNLMVTITAVSALVVVVVTSSVFIVQGLKFLRKVSVTGSSMTDWKVVRSLPFNFKRISGADLAL